MAQIIPLIRDCDGCELESTGSAATLADPTSEELVAEIIIFPGVRYERWEEDGVGGLTGARRGVTQACGARDWLDL